MNRRGNTRQFLEETENKYNNESNNNNNLNFNFNNDFGSFSKAKSDNIGTNDYNNFNMGDNGAIGSLFGMGSRRRHDKNYEI